MFLVYLKKKLSYYSSVSVHSIKPFLLYIYFSRRNTNMNIPKEKLETFVTELMDRYFMFIEIRFTQEVCVHLILYMFSIY